MDRKTITCDFLEVDEAPSGPTIGCHRKAIITKFECLHPPGPRYNQYDGEYGTYLGPPTITPIPPTISYDPTNPSSEETRLHNYFYCYPSYEDEWHIRLNYCDKHLKNPTCTKVEWREMYMKERKAKKEIYSIEGNN